MTTAQGALLFNASLVFLLVGMTLAWGGRISRQRPSLRARVEPYVRRPSARSLLFDATHSNSRLDAVLAVLKRILGPGFKWPVAALAKVYGGGPLTVRRLQRAGRETTLEQYRVTQILCALCGGIVSLVLAIALAQFRGLPVALACIVVAAGFLSGPSLAEWKVTQDIRRREDRMLREFPTVAELLALAVAAGEPPQAAIQRISSLCSGEVVRELSTMLGEVNAGKRLTEALNDLANRNDVIALSRFARTVSVALERGTPLSEVFRAQAQDVREEQKRQLLEVAGKKEILMLVPVVFMILPIVVLFAVFPGLAAINVSL
ncbi:type II secretion system F family protein [Micrococcales bacterium 31B]|nr:type II secretion system F family protein [Micrococcales bacterium 31B]